MNWYRARASVEIPISFAVRPSASEDEILDAAFSEASRKCRGTVLHIDQVEMTVDTSNCAGT